MKTFFIYFNFFTMNGFFLWRYLLNQLSHKIDYWNTRQKGHRKTVLNWRPYGIYKYTPQKSIYWSRYSLCYWITQLNMFRKIYSKTNNKLLNACVKHANCSKTVWRAMELIGTKLGIVCLFVKMLSILNFIMYILLIKNYRKFSFVHFKIQNLQ